MTLGVDFSVCFDAVHDLIGELLSSNLSPHLTTSLCFSLATHDYLKDNGRLFKSLWEVAFLHNEELTGLQRVQLLHSYLMVSTILEIPPPPVEWMSSISDHNFDSSESGMQKEMSVCLNSALLMKSRYPLLKMTS